jgi:hypothetical protein
MFDGLYRYVAYDHGKDITLKTALTDDITTDTNALLFLGYESSFIELPEV